VLIAGVPLFLAMPPWCDVTLYQMAARNVLNGGVHYRDIFDTNLPGFVWLMALAKLLFGWNYTALRVTDLLVVGGAVAALCGWVRRCGSTGYAAAWLAAAAALFYPFTSEFSHIQRDPWMLLPAVLAARLRLRRVLGKHKSERRNPKQGRRHLLSDFEFLLFVRASRRKGSCGGRRCG
jgi:hypothetical protein